VAAVSPEQISRHLRTRFVDTPQMRLCDESIYRAVYRPGSWLMRPTPPRFIEANSASMTCSSAIPNRRA
jgi:IS30 family transposase